MDSLSSFVEDISSYNINLPIWLKISFIVLVIIALLVGGYFLRESFDTTALRDGYKWFITIAVLNLITILLIFIYYGNTNSVMNGQVGIRGKKGKRGKVGSSVTCSYECKTNIYLQSVRKTDTVCRLDTYDENFGNIYTAFSYFQDIINKGSSIDYSGLISNVFLGKKTSSTNQTAIAYFKTLIATPSIAWYLIKIINANATTSSNNTYGTFRAIVPKVGYLPIGDCIYGGNEKFSLNSFVVSGDIMYPSGYDKLITLTAYNSKTDDTNKFTIWRQKSQVVNSKAFDGSNEEHSYLPLGDIISFGTSPPPVNNYAMIKDTCLEPIDTKELKLIFIYVGSLNFSADNTAEYAKSNSYLIQHKLANAVEIFSVWRTPMNTFICNFNSDNDMENNTVYYNMVSNLEDAMNEYGNVSSTYKKWISERLSSIVLPSVLIAMIYARHYQLDATKELIYYASKYQVQIPEFKNVDIGHMNIADLMNLINNTNNAYDKFNQDLIKKASIDISDSKVIKYDASREKHLPEKLLTVYNNIQVNLDNIPVKVENSNNFLDVINIVIPNGLEGRIAVDSSGIAQGGTLLNEIQETLIRMCRILMPPSTKAYIIKDECLGTFGVDNEKRDAIDKLSEEKQIYNKYIDIIQSQANRFRTQIQIIHNYEDLSSRKIGELCGHIPDYMDKIHTMDMEEFTISRVKGLIAIYKEINTNLEKIITNTPQ
jgi:hypothetical protein